MQIQKNKFNNKLLSIIIMVLFSVLISISFISLGFAKGNNYRDLDIENKTNDSSKLAIVMTNDVHCNIMYEDASKEKNEDSKMGYAYLAGFVEKTKTALDDLGQLKYADVDLVSAGDDISGGPGYGFLSKGEKIADLMGDVGYSVTTPGNHEFDYGVSQYDKIVNMLKEKNCESVSCNFADKADDGSLTTHLMPYYAKTYKNGKKIAYIGISTPETISKSNPKNFMDEQGNIVYSFYEDLTGQALYQQIQDTVDHIKDNENPDCIIALAHLGNADYVTPQWNTQNVINNVSGIDAYFDGHSHEIYSNKFPDKEGKDVLCVQAGYKLQFLEKIDIVFNEDGTKTFNDDLYSTDIVTNIDGITETQSYKNINAKLVELKKWYDDITAKKIGTSETILDNKNMYKSEKTIGNFVADAYRNQYDSDIGVVNCGGIRSDINKGDLTIASMIEVNSFANDTVKLKTKGYRILDMLEFGALKVTEDGGEIKYQISGLSFDIRRDIPSSVVVDNNFFVEVNGPRRVQNVKVNGEAINPNKDYTISGTSYVLTDGGGGLTVFAHDDTTIIPTEPPVPDYECLVNYVKNDLHGVISNEQYGHTDGRINFTDKPSGHNEIYYCDNNVERGSLPDTAVFDTSINLAEKGIIGQTGHTCIGWTTNKDANSSNVKHYDFGELFNLQANLLLYPEWSDKQISIENAIIPHIEDQIAHKDGTPVEPEFEVFLNIGGNQVKLQKDIDYTVSYKDNILPGTATVIVSATNFDYKGLTQASFSILPNPLQKFKVSFSSNNLQWGSVEPANDIEVEENTAVSVDENNILHIGEYTIVPKPSKTTEQYSYSFSSWTVNNGNLPDKITENTAFVANFIQNEITTQVVPNSEIGDANSSAQTGDNLEFILLCCVLITISSIVLRSKSKHK